MFFDQVLGKMSRLGDKCHKVTAETRTKIYYRKVRNTETGKIEEIESGRGTEIVSELWTTDAGLKVWEAAHPKAEVKEEESAP